MTHRVDTTVDDVQAAASQPVFDGPGAESEFEQLTAGDHNVLALGELPDAPFDVARLPKPPYFGA
jgi:hypothetical protein